MARPKTALEEATEKAMEDVCHRGAFEEEALLIAIEAVAQANEAAKKKGKKK